jgi:putative spermidine/putrescine transport system permease protein
MAFFMSAIARKSANRLERRESLIALGFMLPALIFIVGFFAVPVAVIIRLAFTDKHGAPSLLQFIRIFSRPMFEHVALGTLDIAISATLFAILLAYPLAYFLAAQPPRRRALLTTLVLVPFWTSALVKSFAFVVILGHTGLINSLLGQLSIAPLPLLFNRVGVIIAMGNYLICFAVFPILTNLIAQPLVLRRAAAIMGASRLSIFFRITLPLSLPGVAVSALLVFILALGFYVMPALLGGLHDMMLSNLVDFYTSEAIDWPMASAIALLLTIVAALAALGLSFIPGGSAIFGAAERAR